MSELCGIGSRASGGQQCPTHLLTIPPTALLQPLLMQRMQRLKCHCAIQPKEDEQSRMIDDDDDGLLPFLLDLKVFFPLLQPQCLPLFRGGLVAVVVQQKGPHLPTDGNINPTKENGLEEGAKVMAGTVLAFPQTATSNCPLLCFGALQFFPDK